MLEEYIKDAIDDEMKDYLTTETYKQQGEEIEKLLYSLRSELTPDQVSTLNRLVNVLGQQHSDFASAAYLRGVVSGIALKNKTLGNKSESIKVNRKKLMHYLHQGVHQLFFQTDLIFFLHNAIPSTTPCKYASDANAPSHTDIASNS